VLTKVKRLSQDFYLDSDAISIAQKLLGKLLVSHINNVKTSGIIVETEAYIGPEDQGSHAKNGRRTPRNENMYAIGGTAYLYKSYGIHDMVNVVTNAEGVPHAILIRAIQPKEGLSIMQLRRGVNANNYHLTGGPGKVAQALGVGTAHDGVSLVKSEILGICDIDNEIFQENIIIGPRVGMSKYVGSWANSPLRFYVKDNPWVSRPLKISYPLEWSLI